MMMIEHGSIFDDCVFELYDANENNNGNQVCNRIDVKRQYRGAWLLVDNGYNSWPTTVPPIKTTANTKGNSFFGMVGIHEKGCGVHLWNTKRSLQNFEEWNSNIRYRMCRQYFLTRCALHNWLLKIDGLDDQWKEGTASDWEVESFEVANKTTQNDNKDDNGNFTDGQDMTMEDTTMTASAGDETDDYSRQQHAGEKGGNNLQLAADVPNAIHRLYHPMTRRDGVIYTTENVVDCGVVHLMEEEEPLTVGGIACVRMLSLDFFRSKLVTHFDIAYKRNKLKWPRRMKSRRPATNQ